MRRKSLMACIALCPFVIGASEPIRIAPSSAWNLDYADNSCRLIREFGEGRTSTLLVFEGAAPGQMSMLVIGGTLRVLRDKGEVKARLLPGRDDPFTGTTAQAEHGAKGAAFWTASPLTQGWSGLLMMNSPNYRSPVSRQNIDLAEREADRARRTALATSMTQVNVMPAGGRAMVLETGSLGKAIAMFDECERDLLRQWGVDPTIEDKIVKPVWAPKQFSWFNAGDYPNEALANHEESTVTVRLAVDSSGKVTKCASLSAYNAPSFNKVVCDVYLTRAKFSPAELADGTKVASYFSQTINFRMP